MHYLDSARLMAMGASPDPLAQRLADIRGRLDHPPGVMLGVVRLPIMDSILEDLEAAVPLDAPAHRSDASAMVTPPPLDKAAIHEIELTIDLLSSHLLGESSEALGRRVRLVEVLRRATGGALPGRAFDPADAFGVEMGTMLATDAELGDRLGDLHPLVIRATAVVPSARWIREARAFAGGRGPDAYLAAARRALAALLRAEIVSRPDLLVGGLRLPNQRLARGLLWFVAAVDDAPAELLGAIGIRMGTSGRRDAVVRDTAVANTCAALLGSSADPGSAAALASMRVKVVNRNVLKQVDRGLAEIAARAGLPVEAVVEDALPAFGLDATGRLEATAGDVAVRLELTDGGAVEQRWRTPDGREHPAPPPEVVAADPGEVGRIAELVAAIEAAVADERRRMETRLGSERSWPASTWRRRFLEHPIGGRFGRGLVWVVGHEPPRGTAVKATDDGWADIAGAPLPGGVASGDDRGDRHALREPTVWLWHPADADAREVVAWRASLAAAGVQQPIRQADREAFRPLERDRDLAADRRFAGRIVDHAQLRALLRERGWAVPALGSWDQGDEATAWRAFDGDLRAELRCQAVERLPTGARHERARLIAVRFVRVAAEVHGLSAAAAAAADAPRTSIELAGVPLRVFSEAIRDVSLVVAVAEVAGPGPGDR